MISSSFWSDEGVREPVNRGFLFYPLFLEREGAGGEFEIEAEVKNEKKNLARSLRKNQTEREQFFWQLVRNRKLLGKKFLRQCPIDFIYMGKIRYFIADFYCAEEKLVVGIDGKIHEKQVDYDEFRTYIINQLGIRVVRIKNEELDNRDKVIETVKSHFSPPNSPPTPLFCEKEGRRARDEG